MKDGTSLSAAKEKSSAKPAAPKSAPKKVREKAPGEGTHVRPAVSAVRPRKRHFMLALSFVLWVLMPLGAAGTYLYTIAENQYASRVAFTVRKEEVNSTMEILGGITSLSGASSSDTDVLYEFIQSQEMVRRVGEEIDLRQIYYRPEDPLFSLGKDTRIEALTRYWNRMVKIYYDSASGLIEIRVLAFDAKSAQSIAQQIFQQSSQMINALSDVAREDATRYARTELVNALERLKQARQAMIEFQSRTHIIDPSADISGRMGLLNSLLAQLATAKIEREVILQNTQTANDPRLVQVEYKLRAIQKLIDEERDQLINGNGPEIAGQDYVNLLGEYESLRVDLEFSQEMYVGALAALDAALAEARRKSRYLAAYIEPSLPESSEYPRRIGLMLTLAAFLLISWALLVMIYYSVRDRR